MNQVCFDASENIIALVAAAIAAAHALSSILFNFVPAPDQITNPFLRVLSRALHFVAFDIVTAVKK